MMAAEDIERWAISGELSDELAEMEKNDYPAFERLVLCQCDDLVLLKFAANRAAKVRKFFASALVERLVAALYTPHRLPYEFSRFGGLMSWNEFRELELQRVTKVYEGCRVVEEMRLSQQEEIKQLANTLLDYRHRRLGGSSWDHHKLLLILKVSIESSFNPGVVSYQLRQCDVCRGYFKFWYARGQEDATADCLWCRLGISEK